MSHKITIVYERDGCFVLDMTTHFRVVQSTGYNLFPATFETQKEAREVLDKILDFLEQENHRTSKNPRK